MPKPRTKRSNLRDEKKRKRQEDDSSDPTKRVRAEPEEPSVAPVAEEPQDPSNPEDADPAWEISTAPSNTRGYDMTTYENEDAYDPSYNDQSYNDHAEERPEREFFGMLTDEEQEYFRSADEILDLNNFETPHDRDIFLRNVYKEARGKELKLASSQSCSRLMERLILLSSAKQKKHLFEQFAGHFYSMVQHRFASHCCETLFLQSGPVVSLEMAGEEPVVEDTEETEEDDLDENGNKRIYSSMEDMFLLTLDELDGHLSSLITDRYASHTLRVLLITLSGRPLADAKTKSLLKSKNAEYITVANPVLSATPELTKSLRPVPPSFAAAVTKIIGDITASLDATGIRVMARHPTGNPLFQLLLELDLSLRPKASKKKAEKEDTSLLSLFLPGAPESLSQNDSPASDFFNSLIYDPIGSRLIETIITHCPAKIFKALQANMFKPRIASYARNDTASYAAIKALERMSGKDLAEAIDAVLPTVPALLERGRFNVVKVLLARAHARGVKDRIEGLRNAIVQAVSNDPKNLVPKLCIPPSTENKPKGPPTADPLPERAPTHAAQLLTTMLSIPGPPTKAVQTSLLSLPADTILPLCTLTPSHTTLITTALTTPSLTPHFHKFLIATIIPHTVALSTHQTGHRILLTILSTPTKSPEISCPFHLKEQIMNHLGSHEVHLRESWAGRLVWRTWKGDFWKRKRLDWVRWVKEVDGSAPEERFAQRADVNKGKAKYLSKNDWERQKFEKRQEKTVKPPRRPRAGEWGQDDQMQE